LLSFSFKISFMPTIDTLEALLKHELKDLYSAETQIIKSLPELIDAATNTDLKWRWPNTFL